MQFFFSGLTSGSIYVLVALGFTVIYNSCGVINFAQGEFLMLGGMFLYSALTMLGVPFIPAFFMTVFAAIIIGVLFERIFITPVRVKSSMNLVTITIAGSIIMRDIAMLTWGRDTLMVPNYLSDKNFNIIGGVVSLQSLVTIAVCALLAVSLHGILKYSKYGKAMRACFEDPLAAKLCGVNAVNYRRVSFGIAGFLGAVGGVLIAPVSFVTYNDGVMSGVKGFAAAILGGLGSFGGAVAGGYILGLMEAFASSVVPSGYKNVVAFVVILLVLVFRPWGLFGKKKVERI